MNTINSNTNIAFKKGQLEKFFPSIPYKEAARAASEIIAKNRNIDIDVAKHKQIIRPNELDLFKKRFGFS